MSLTNQNLRDQAARLEKSLGNVKEVVAESVWARDNRQIEEASPLSDYNRVVACNQFALPLLGYLICTQHWALTELRKVDRKARKTVVENGGKH